MRDVLSSLKAEDDGLGDLEVVLVVLRAERRARIADDGVADIEAKRDVFGGAVFDGFAVVEGKISGAREAEHGDGRCRGSLIIQDRRKSRHGRWRKRGDGVRRRAGRGHRAGGNRTENAAEIHKARANHAVKSPATRRWTEPQAEKPFRNVAAREIR